MAGSKPSAGGTSERLSSRNLAVDAVTVSEGPEESTKLTGRRRALVSVDFAEIAHCDTKLWSFLVMLTLNLPFLKSPSWYVYVVT
jgi:hypothetical protein